MIWRMWGNETWRDQRVTFEVDKENIYLKKKKEARVCKTGESEREEKSLIQTVARLGYVSDATYKELPCFTYHF